jgi:DNA-binding transcriptional MerR regulator
MLLKVGDLARRTGLTVRTLHHYDEIGLLVPSRRSAAGYRQYDDADLLRLQQIMLQRELGLPLEEIRRCLDDPKFDRRQALLAQRSQLEQRARQTADMLRAVDRALELLGQLEQENPMDRKELFNGFQHPPHAEEARQRWGHTDAYAEAGRRTRGYSAEDWQRFAAEQSALLADAFALLSAGQPPDGAAARAVAERHRLSIDHWFYPCDHERHRGLAGSYESDARFAANIDRHGAGLTTFLVAAIRANAERSGPE